VNLVTVSPWDLAWAAALVLALAWVSHRNRLGIERPLLMAATRMVVQLVLIGFVLKALFASMHPLLIAVLALIMVAMAGQEAGSRLKRRMSGGWGRFLIVGPLFVSSFSVTVLALAVVISPEPWYHPRYSIPLLGMMLGNGMSSVSLVLNHLLDTVPTRREEIEQRLLLGENREQAVHDIRRDAIHTGSIPMINAMTAAGIVSLPGVMTGQVLAGAPPLEAVSFQLLIMLLITASSGFAQVLAVRLAVNRLFDERHRLRLDRLES